MDLLFLVSLSLLARGIPFLRLIIPISGLFFNKLQQKWPLIVLIRIRKHLELGMIAGCAFMACDDLQDPKQIMENKVLPTQAGGQTPKDLKTIYCYQPFL